MCQFGCITSKSNIWVPVHQRLLVTRRHIRQNLNKYSRSQHLLPVLQSLPELQPHPQPSQLPLDPAFNCRPYVSAQYCSSYAARSHNTSILSCSAARDVFLRLLKYSFMYKLKLTRCVTTSDMHGCRALEKVRCDVSGMIDAPSDIARNEG